MPFSALTAIAHNLSQQLNPLKFTGAVHTIYNPLAYAWQQHQTFLERFDPGDRPVMFLGMNPGPFGMAQTGVPFSDPSIAQQLFGIDCDFTAPTVQHPKRPIMGKLSTRKEGSGGRLWRWVVDYFGDIDNFTNQVLIWNYCPLCFLNQNGANLTPDKLIKKDQEKLYKKCDLALRAVAENKKVRTVVALGRFAEERSKIALNGTDTQIIYLLHPSPANPRANREWPQLATGLMQQLLI